MRRALAFIVLAVALGAGAAQADDAVAPAPAPPAPMAWSNPVVADDFPDPSAARVDGVYWAVSTATARAPGFPILRSADLLHWDQAGTVFAQLPAWAADSLWAPELVVDQAGTRVYYSARRRTGRLCVAVASAPSPAGPYSDRGPLVCQRAGSIDPTQVRDAAGRPYLVWKEDGNAIHRPSRIWIRPLRADGLALAGHKRELLRNADRWEGSVVEAPEIVAHDGWLYLLYSGNTYGPPPHCAYALGAARSRSVFGPWRRDPANPILRSNRAWRCPGHASPVGDDSGRLFLLYHAYPAAAGALAPRQALLDQVTWTPHGWPTVNGGRGPSTAVSIG